MRMRRKKNLIPRLEKCSDVIISNPQEHKGRWRQLWGHEGQLHLEIGCGKGDFIVKSAEKYPDIMFVAIERYQNVLLLAAEKAMAAGVKNLLFIDADAALLEEIFAPDEIDRIYLNFSDPWPRNKHAKRRLTWDDYLHKYQHILKDEGTLRFKTDNPQLFDWSVARFADNGWEPVALSHDLPLEESGIISEYETRYRRYGQPICCGEWKKGRK